MPGQHYRTNHLTRVILRVDHEALPRPAQLPQESVVARRLERVFPIVTGAPIGSLLVNVSPTGSGIEQQLTGMQWEHRKTQGGTKILYTSPSHISLEYGRGDYDHFPPFVTEFQTAFTAYTEVYPDLRIKRVGLRYVNEIRFDQGNPLSWDGIIAPRLVDAVKAAIAEDGSLVRSMHQVHWRKNDNLDVILSYGLFNSEYPAALSRREFIIDIDASRAHQVPLNEVVTTATTLNELAEGAFEECIANELRQQMGVIND